MPRKGFFAATPLREIAELNIGSRPASCKATQAIEDLRAIASVFSWGPCRLDLPGWCGLGSAVEAFLKDRVTAVLKLLHRMHRQWPFFRTLPSNLDMVLAKTDPALARSLEHRIPYLDPLNHLQVELLRRYRQRRADDPESARVQRGIHLSINRLAAGLRNTG